MLNLNYSDSILSKKIKILFQINFIVYCFFENLLDSIRIPFLYIMFPYVKVLNVLYYDNTLMLI